MFKPLFALMALVFFMPVQAGIYKCTDANGKVAFSDKPCAEDAQIIELEQSNVIGTAQAAVGQSITLADGSVQKFKKILSLEVRTKSGYRTSKEGLYVYYNGSDRLIEFDDLVSLKVVDYDRKPCGNTGHLCHPSVLIETQKTELRARYEALRNITLLIDDELVGEEKELVVWFAADSKQQIRSIAF